MLVQGRHVVGDDSVCAEAPTSHTSRSILADLLQRRIQVPFSDVSMQLLIERGHVSAHSLNHSITSSCGAVSGIAKPHCTSPHFVYLSFVGTLSDDSPSRADVLMGHELTATRLSGRWVSAQATPEYVVPKSMPTIILCSLMRSLPGSMSVRMSMTADGGAPCRWGCGPRFAGLADLHAGLTRMLDHSDGGLPKRRILLRGRRIKSADIVSRHRGALSYGEAPFCLAGSQRSVRLGRRPC